MKLFVIFGKARSGKNTVATLLKENLTKYNYKPCIMHITEPLYSYARNYFNWDETKDEKPRAFLQKMGIDIIEKNLSKKHFLLHRLKEDIEILNNFFNIFIITDARLQKELDYFKKTYTEVVTIKIERKAYDNNLTKEQKNHITEKEVDTLKNFDYIITNDSKESLKEQVKNIIENEIKGEYYE